MTHRRFITLVAHPGAEKAQSGSVLALVVIFAAVMLLAVSGIVLLGGQEATLAAYDIRRVQALFLAESGLQIGKAWLDARDTAPAFTDAFCPFGHHPDTLCQGTYHVSMTPDPANPTSDRKLFTITSIGTAKNRSRILEYDVASQTWADYFYYTDREKTPGAGGEAWFFTGDYLGGKVHTNSQFHIFGDPVFAGRVTSSADMFEYYNGDPVNHIESAASSNPPHDHPSFERGYGLGQKEIGLPNNLNALRALAGDGGIRLSGNYEIVLSREDDEGNPMYGYVSYRGNKRWLDVPISSFNGVIFINGGAHISGVLDGQLTIGTTSNMYIDDDITYLDSDADGPLPYCDDGLGLVSGSDIVIENNVANRDDCTIHAHLMALHNSFKADGVGSGQPRGVLTVHGGIVQTSRGAVGKAELVDGQPVVVSGYVKDYYYDERLEENAPPGYGVIDMEGACYTVLRWRELRVE